MNDTTAITDSLEMVVRNGDGTVKNYIYIKGGWEFVPNERFLAALNSGSQPWRFHGLYGQWRRLTGDTK